MAIEEKQLIESAIVTARDGVGERIDELDRHLRANYDPKALARSYAPHLVAGGAILGVLVGFAFPRVFRKVVTWSVPIAILGMTIRNSKEKEKKMSGAGF